MVQVEGAAKLMGRPKRILCRLSNMIMPYNVINITYQGQSTKEKKKENDNICLVLSSTFVKKVTVLVKKS
jgi:hypothetical protein